MRFLSVLFLFLLSCLYGCKENPPAVSDGNGSIVFQAVWNKSTDSIPDIVPLQNAKVIMNCQYGIQIYYTGSDGFLRLNHLPSALYNISIRAPHPADPTIILVGSIRGVNITSGQTSVSTDTAKPVSSTGIAINEIYSVGPVNNIFYFYDLFIELYNSSDSVKYVDGMQVMRVNGYINNEIYKCRKIECLQSLFKKYNLAPDYMIYQISDNGERTWVKMLSASPLFSVAFESGDFVTLHVPVSALSFSTVKP